MAFTYVWEETSEGQPASTGYTAGQKLSRSLRVYILTSTGTVFGSDVLAALALEASLAPYKGQPHPAYGLALCSDVRADVDADQPWMWRVSADYAEAMPQGGDDPTSYEAPNESGTPSPDVRLPLIDLDFRGVDVARYRDLFGLSVTNAAGDPFENAPPFEDCVAVVQVSRLFASWSIEAGEAYFGKWNADTYLTKPPGYWRIKGVRAVPTTEKGWPAPLWKVTWTLEGRNLPEATEVGQTGYWQYVAVANFGWNFLNADGEKVAARSVYGDNLAAPVRLAADGTLLDVAADPNDTTYKFFSYYGSVSFALLTP